MTPYSSNSAGARFELFDHTADVGVRVFASTLAGLVLPAAQGLYAVIGELAAGADAGPLAMFRSRGEGEGRALLLREFLATLLWVFESEQRMVTRVEVPRFDDHGLKVTADTALVDPSRTVYHREVKAVTYHALDIRETGDGYEATFIVDI